jgi:hypothetical protein
MVLFKQPVSPKAFDAYCHGEHLPLAETPPGLRGHEASRAPVQGACIR